MRFLTFTVAAVLIAACSVYNGSVRAAILATDPAAMTGFHGSQSFLAAIGPLSFSASVDYAVYAPGAFHSSDALGSPVDPSGGTQYVYAYQLSNTGTPNQRTVGELSIGFNGDQSPQNLSLISGPALGINPASMALVPSGPPYSSATWTYSPELTSGQAGNVLLFTSPNPPGAFFNASVAGGGLAAQESLPSPVPEPSALVLLAMGLLLLRRNRRRVSSEAAIPAQGNH